MSVVLQEAVRLGAATGLRSTAGFSRLSLSPLRPPGSALDGSVVRTFTLFALAGETVADKTPRVPPRTDPLPLVGRAVLAGAASAVAASWRGKAPHLPALAGAATAVATAWVATSVRREAARVGVPDLVPALLEDAGVWALIRGE